MISNETISALPIQYNNLNGSLLELPHFVVYLVDIRLLEYDFYAVMHKKIVSI